MCGCFCIGFIGFMLKGKSLLEYTNLFSPNEYEKNGKVKLKYFQNEIKKIFKIRKICCVACDKYKKKLKTLKYHIFYKKP